MEKGNQGPRGFAFEGGCVRARARANHLRYGEMVKKRLQFNGAIPLGMFRYGIYFKVFTRDYENWNDDGAGLQSTEPLSLCSAREL